ncbi:CheB methylesterase domain-containing protein [Anaerovibrio sp.]|uniref:CheB methylesterase domain-containing protein n=1 Tax=Anaerovibrio sp. TaxID=1872532 RepID=UPI0025811C73|nr:CheB methylesterase domain-containing protein [Anaerovibrio sp.]
MFATKKIEKRESYTSAPSTSWCSLIAIGSSTGGTEALSEILSKLKPPLPPVMVVQHISATFSKLFAARLDRECELTVKEAVEGEYAKPNTIYIAPGDKHMSITGSPGSICIHCKAGERIHGVLSSADVLFESVAKVIGPKAVGVILTGMGVDGAAKLLEMRQAGARTLGQDEASCVVYGMPKAAFNMGAVERQVSLQNMANEITKLVYSSR